MRCVNRLTMFLTFSLVDSKLKPSFFWFGSVTIRCNAPEL